MQEKKPLERVTIKEGETLDIETKRSKLVRSMTPLKFVNSVVDVSKNKAFLKGYQLKRLNMILDKSLNGFPADLKDYESVIDMQSTIKAYMVSNNMNSGARISRIRRLPLTRLRTNTKD
tara:strand:+ start:210 stop:566 length:357 start_codon:yes stop_codon:yes gene_type:complete